MGESIIKASLRGKYCGFCTKTFPVSTGVPRAFGTPNHLGLQPIITELYPWTGWERFIDSPSVDSSVDFWLHFFTEREAPSSSVRSNIVTYLTTANINVAPGPFATDI